MKTENEVLESHWYEYIEQMKGEWPQEPRRLAKV